MMNMRMLQRHCAAMMCLTFLVVTGCRQEVDALSDSTRTGAEPDASVTNRIDIPPSVRQNLGITFVKVERRPVRTTVRIPGQFELNPEARRDYHVMLTGRVDLLVKQHQSIATGDPLFHLDSPQWQQMKSDLAASLNVMLRSHANLAVAEAKYVEVEKSIEFLQHRISNLADANVRQVEVDADLANKRNMLPRLRADVDAVQAEFDAAHMNYDVLIDTAVSVTGLPRTELDEDDDAHVHMRDSLPPWRSINRLTIHAEASGIVDVVAVTNRGWAKTGELVLTTIDPNNVRFHGGALQTDINIFADGQSARITPPQGGSIDLQDTIDGTITVGYRAHPDQRTIPIHMEPATLPRWAKPGVTAYLEVFTDGDANPTLAIPERAVIRDGLDVVYFRRDPDDSAKVIRVDADLGATDGRWVEVLSGVGLGDEIVLGGVYPLMLSSSQTGGRMEGGHFHADGTFHESDEE